MKLKEKEVYYAIINKNEINGVQSYDNNTEMACAVLKKMCEYLEIPYLNIVRNKYGKPYFENSRTYFNYSHTKNYIACVLSSKEVGIDIEQNRDVSDSIVKKYLDNPQNQKERLEQWVKKEAYSKMKAKGLQYGFKNINLNQIKESSHFFRENDYICAIYVQDTNYKFIEISKNVEI